MNGAARWNDLGHKFVFTGTGKIRGSGNGVRVDGTGPSRTICSSLLPIWLAAAAITILAGPVNGLLFGQNRGGDQSVRQSARQQPQQEGDPRDENPFDGDAAMKDLIAICEIGPRVSGTRGMTKQREMLIERFEKLGAKILKQEFNRRHPVTGRRVKLVNLIVQWHPEKKQRILLCTHYDTRPFPDRDPVDPQGVFLGANDGASGCAVFLELAKHMDKLDGKYGIDFVFFDAEEFVYKKGRDPFFVGSTYFARQYVKQREVQYLAGILIDMIGDEHLELYYEENSLLHAGDITRSIWQTADELGIREFVPRKLHKIRDDHLPLNTIAKIPTCDIIDFDYPTIQKGNQYWHTRMDKPDKCSGDSLAKVGWVLIEWLKKVQNPGKSNR